MNIDPIADIREIWILLPQLFHEAVGDTRQDSFTYTYTHIMVVMHIYCVFNCEGHSRFSDGEHSNSNETFLH